MYYFFTHTLDNWCENALDLKNGKLIVESTYWIHDKSVLLFARYCHWLISAIDDKHYVNLELENIDVRID